MRGVRRSADAGRMRRTIQLDLVRELSPKVQKLYYRGLQAHLRGDKVGARNAYLKALKHDKKAWAVLYSVAVLCHQICEHEHAAKILRDMTKARPGFMEAWFNLGTVLQHIGQYEEAEQALRKALEIAPDFVGAITNLGNACFGLGKFAEAHELYERAMGMEATDPEASFNLAHVLLVTGHWTRGWKHFEDRWQIPGFREANAVEVDVNQADAPHPWQGAPLTGKRLIVVSEQGAGDNIMALRFAPMLRAIAKEVTWAMPPSLVRLARATVAPDQVVSTDEPMPGSDYIVSTMSLMYRLGITPDNIPGAEGYLKAA